MNAEIQPARKRFGIGKIALVIGIMGLILMFVFPTIVRALVSSNLARIRAGFLIQKVALPDGMEEIAFFSKGDVDNGWCYQGIATILAGTDLDIEAIGSFYNSFFAAWDWKVENKLATEDLLYFLAGSKEEAKCGKPIESVTIHYCDKTCLSSFDFSPTVIQIAEKEYKNLYLISAWYIPVEVRSTLCFCYTSD